MLKKIIAASFFISGALIFFIAIGNMTSGLKKPKDTKVAKIRYSDKVKLGAKVKLTVNKNLTQAQKGEQMFRKRCYGCHTVGKAAPNRTGPNLWRIAGREKGSARGFRYSRSLKLLGGVWTDKEISQFIAGPRAMIADTKMTFSGVKVEEDRKNIVAYLNTLKD